MELKKNVVAAITTAVQLYMSAEQPVSVVEEVPAALEPPRPGLSPWALSGRQAAMDMRRLWQMRLVR
jgi:hypothetical protein